MASLPQTVPTPQPRHRRFEQLAYGLFLHWGLYSLLDAGEWILHHRPMAPARYRSLTKRFRAEQFDAPLLVAWAQRVGFRYLCLTTRHHDGFSLYDTRGLNVYDAPHSAAGRDLVKELADACQTAGLALFFYHTTLDWSHPAFDRDWDAYQKYLRASVEILCTQYGEVDGFWFDGNWSRPDRDWQEDALYSMIRLHQPEAVLINNSSVQARGRTGHPELDVLTFEQGAPGVISREGQPKYLVPEMCDTVTSHWGAAQAGDFSAKSPAQLISTLAACRGRGANLLLNVGPEASGRLPAYETAALEIVGKWIQRGPGDVLYDGVSLSLSCGRRDDFVLRAGERLYYFAHDVGVHGLLHLGGTDKSWRTVEGELPRIKGVHWTDGHEPLNFVQKRVESFFAFQSSPNPYGTQPVVRVAELEI